MKNLKNEDYTNRTSNKKPPNLKKSISAPKNCDEWNEAINPNTKHATPTKSNKKM